jgi:hypothetical protein
MITDAILHRTPEAPSNLNSGVPSRLEEIILKALEKDRKFRYQFAAEIRTDLQRLQRAIGFQQPVSAPAVPDKVKVAHSRSWKRWVLAGAVVAVLAFATLKIASFGPLWLRHAPQRSSPSRTSATRASATLPEISRPPAVAVIPNKRRLPPLTRLIDLSAAYNVRGIYTEGTSFDAGLDRVGAAFSAETLGPTMVWDTVKFTLGPANAPNVVTSRTIPLAAGRFDRLKMLAVAVEGDQESQVFTVTYSDGTFSSFYQSLSDWYTPENFSGESQVAVTPYRLSGGGGRDNRTFYLYGYSFSLNNQKTVQSFTLPSNENVLVFGVALIRGSDENVQSSNAGDRISANR